LKVETLRAFVREYDVSFVCRD